MSKSFKRLLVLLTTMAVIAVVNSLSSADIDNEAHSIVEQTPVKRMGLSLAATDEFKYIRLDPPKPEIKVDKDKQQKQLEETARKERIEKERLEKERKAKAKQARAKQGKDKVKQSDSSNKQVNTSNAEDMLLAKLVHAEANGEPYKGKVAVAEVVLNRVKSGKFPNRIKDVIYQKGQFSPVSDGSINNSPTAQDYKAVAEAKAGANYARGALFFYNPAAATSRWLDPFPTITTIGGHVFK